MAKKSIYASVEIADREVRLVVVEIFNNRSNVLRTERAAHTGIANGKITDEKSIVEAIEQCVSLAQEALGYHIESVLLAIPARDLKTVRTDVHIEIEDGTHTVRRFHIQQGLKSAMESVRYDDLILVNADRIVYSINGEVMDTMPLGFDTTDFDMEVDLLFANRELVFSWTRAVEKAGLKVLDIAVDLYAASKETGSLLQSADVPVILIDLEADHTSLALLSDNKMAFGAILDQGFRSFTASLEQAYSLSEATAWRLLENLFSSSEDKADDSIVYIEQQEGRRVELTARQLANAVLPIIRSWIAEINGASAPILSKTRARYLITGEGSAIPALSGMTALFNAPADLYTVTSIGARNGAFATCLGLAYVYEDASAISGKDRISVNSNELEESIESISRFTKNEEGGFTKKLKRVMLTSKH